MSKKTRYFVLDTSVLLHDQKSLFTFKGATIVIPFVVLEELDTFKSERGEIGQNARAVIRTVDEMRAKGKLGKGVPIDHDTEGSQLLVLPSPPTDDTTYISANHADNVIIQTVRELAAKGHEVVFVSKDINARVKADALGLEAEDYAKGLVDANEYYKGYSTYPIAPNELRSMGPSRLPELLREVKLSLNEFVVLESDKNPENYRVFRHIGGMNFKEVGIPQLSWHFTPRNVQQLMALDLLMDDDISLISLVGPAGTGKTFLTLLAGLEKVAQEHVYNKLLLTRPVVALGADIGYLPGDVQEKLHHWMMPIKDNLDFIFSQQRDSFDEMTKQENGRRPRRNNRRRYGEERPREITDIDVLQREGIISIEAITYMRGRSIPHQFIFIDEVQNLTPHEVKTIVSRAGVGSKVILCGDPYQIDSPYLDFTSNGLTVTTEKFRNADVFGTVYLEKTERSHLAELAAQLL